MFFNHTRHALSLLAGSLLCAMTFTAQANELGLATSNQYLEVDYVASITSDFITELSILHANKYNRKNTFASAGLFADQTFEDINLHLRAGGKFYYLDAPKSIDTYGLAFGVSVAYTFIHRAYIAGNFFYAPDIVSGGDFENLLDAEVSIGYGILDSADLFLGYRFLEVRNGDWSNYDIYKGAFLGFKFIF